MSLNTHGGYTTDDMRITRQQIEEETIASHSVDSNHSLRSIGGLILGASISMFGAYSLIRAYNDGKTDASSYLMLLGFLLVLVVVDAIKRGALAKFFNSVIRARVFDYSSNMSYRNIVIGTFVFMIVFDTIGVYTTSEYVSEQNIKSKVTESLELSALQSSASASVENAKLYRTELSSWEQDKKDGFRNCMDKWKGWKPKYKAKCKEDWIALNPKPEAYAVTSVSTDDIKSLKDEKTSLFDEALFYVVFVMLLALTVIMQYLTVIQQFDAYQKALEELTPSEIEELEGIVLDKMEIIEEHNRQFEEIVANAKAESMKLDRELKEATTNVSLAKKRKRVEREQEKACLSHYNTPSAPTNNHKQPTPPKIDVPSKSAFIGEPKKEISRVSDEVKSLAGAMLDGIAKGDKINSRETLREMGLKFNNLKLQSARSYLVSKGIIQKNGNSFIKV